MDESLASPSLAVASSSMTTRIEAERLVDCLADADPLLVAVDVTTWLRCDAECSPERGTTTPHAIRQDS